MSAKKHNKLALVKKHRELQYERSLDKLIDGKVPVEYVSNRWQKLKILPK